MKKCGVIFLAFVSFFFLFSFVPVSADSGWDNSYGGGGFGGFDGGSYGGFGGSSSGGTFYDFSSGDTEYSADYYLFEVFFCIAFFLILLFVIVAKSKKRTHFSNDTEKTITSRSVFRHIPFASNEKQEETYESHKSEFYEGLEIFKKYFPNMTKQDLLDQFFSIFVSIQEAWMNFDYDKLEKLCSDELFQSYQSDLEVLKMKNGKNVMHDFEKIFSNIQRIREEDGKIIVDVYLFVSFYDYVIDANTEKILQGNQDSPMSCKYHLVFVKNLEVEGNCPNCGAEKQKRECEFCHTILPAPNQDFVLSQKERIHY